ncbi:MAG: rhomboid family intramembrane serine protease [Paracoccaceae bacterium]|nr:rhomboid family intramembrane serine protease [Paracoccaceae bacterium]
MFGPTPGDYAILALSAVLLGIALVVGLSNKRRPSLHVEVFVFLLVGAYLLQILMPYYVREEFALRFGFIPARYVAEYTPPWAPGGWPAYLWSPFTHAFLHHDGVHLFGNGLVLFIFGRAVAWRLGGRGFLLVFFLSAAIGAIVHGLYYWGDPTPLIGASGGVFGVVGATFRFVPLAEDQLKALFWPGTELRAMELAEVRELLTTWRYLKYVLLCFIAFPLGLIAFIVGASGDVAVLAHIGGFAAGFFGIRQIERRRPVIAFGPQPEPASGPEPFGLRVLRVLAILMLLAGVALGALEYYIVVFEV